MKRKWKAEITIQVNEIKIIEKINEEKVFLLKR
jgi:hypothetical protein